MAKELQGKQNLGSESDEGNSSPLLEIKKPSEDMETESHPVFIPPESSSAVFPSQDLELTTMAKELQGQQNLQSESDEGNTSQVLLQIKKLIHKDAIPNLLFQKVCDDDDAIAAVVTESDPVFIPAENGSAIVPLQENGSAIVPPQETMAKELQGQQNLQSESDEGNTSQVLLQMKELIHEDAIPNRLFQKVCDDDAIVAVDTESDPVSIPAENGSAIVPLQENGSAVVPPQETMAKELHGEQNLESKSDELNSSLLLQIKNRFEKVETEFPPVFIPPESNSAVVQQFVAICPPFNSLQVQPVRESDVVISRPGKTFIMRERTNLEELKELLPDEEIAEGDAVCEKCWKPFKVNEDMVKTKCECDNQLFHEACVDITSNCGSCKQQVQRIPLTLLQLPPPDDATVNKTESGKKHKWFSLFKR